MNFREYTQNRKLDDFHTTAARRLLARYYSCLGKMFNPQSDLSPEAWDREIEHAKIGWHNLVEVTFADFD